jgi:hypothetical protein
MMRNTVLLVLGIFASLAAAQQAATSRGFHWDWHKATALSWKQDIGSLHLSTAEKNLLVAAIEPDFRGVLSDSGIKAAELEKDIAETRFELIDLDDGHTKEIIAQATDSFQCGATGNCASWVLHRDRDNYRVILKGMAQTFTIQPTRTNGLRDIVLGLHRSATWQKLHLYNFDGSSYRDTACYDAMWEVLDEKGEIHSLNAPRISPCGKK